MAARRMLAAGIALGLFAFAVYAAVRGSLPDTVRQTSPAGAASPEQPAISGWQGRGIDVTDIVDGRPVSSLRVERVRFEPGPLGFFRVGFLQMPVLDDARLTVHMDSGSGGKGTPIDAVESALGSLLKREERTGLGWIGGFTALKASPFHAQVFRGGLEVLSLECATASVDFHQRRLDLEGQVRLSADGGARTVESDRLRLSLGTQEVWTDGEVHLRTPEGYSKRQGFKADVFLRTVAVQPGAPDGKEPTRNHTVSRVEEEARP
jgi:hypothetical protein